MSPVIAWQRCTRNYNICQDSIEHMQIIYYAILYYTILYYTILYYTILYYK